MQFSTPWQTPSPQTAGLLAAAAATAAPPQSLGHVATVSSKTDSQAPLLLHRAAGRYAGIVVVWAAAVEPLAVTVTAAAFWVRRQSDGWLKRHRVTEAPPADVESTCRGRGGEGGRPVGV